MKLKFLISVLSLLLLSANIYSGACDCTTYPVVTECRKDCSLKLLQVGTTKQLEDMLGMDSILAKRITSTPNRKSKKSIEEFGDSLTHNDYIKLQEKINTWIYTSSNSTNQGTLNQTNVNGDNVGGNKTVINPK